MKILHIIENLDTSYGGPAKSVPLLVKHLNQLETTNIIFSVQVLDNESNDVIKNSSIDIIKAPLIGFKKLKYALLKKAIIHQITDETIIHVHSLWTYPAYLGYQIAREYNLPLVVSTRGMMYTWALKQRRCVKTIAMYLFQKSMLKHANVIHITEPNEKKALQKLNIQNRTILIPNGIELQNPFSSLNIELLKKINYNSEKRYIMFLGRIVHNKGIHYLINSFIKLHNEYSDHVLLIVGGIEDKQYYKSLIKMDKIYFLDTLDGIDKHTIFSIAELFVLPSFSENFGMAIAEALNYGIPVITTTGTPWKEIQDKNIGWWIELSQEILDQTLREAISLSPTELKKKGQRGKELVKQYSINIQALKMKQCYETLLN